MEERTRLASYNWGGLAFWQGKGKARVTTDVVSKELEGNIGKENVKKKHKISCIL